MDEEESHTPREITEATTEGCSSEMNSQTDEINNHKLNDFKRRNENFRMGFSKNIQYMNWRRKDQKPISEHLTKELSMSYKSPTCNGNVSQKDSADNVVETNGAQPAEDIIEGGAEEKISAADEMSMINDHLLDHISKETSAVVYEGKKFEFVEAELSRINVSTKADEIEETKHGAGTEDSEGHVSTR